MKKIATYSTLILITLFFTNCSEKSLKQEMAAYDRGFIPVMYYAKTDNAYRAKSAAFYLDFQWRNLKKKLVPYTNSHQEYMNHVNRMENWLGAVYSSVDSNNASLAAIYLDHANYEMRAFRARHQIDYYLDYIYDLQDQVEILDEVAQDEMLCLLEWNEFESIYQEVINNWNLYKKQPISYKLFKLSTEKENDFLQHYIGMCERMERLATKMDCGDRAAIAETTYILKMDVLQLLAAFGNFDASKVHYANQDAVAETNQ